MKKATLSRILGLALALVLVLSTSVAFALPSGTSAIEGLPEKPTVPTMVTSAKGTEYTITLSEKLNWLNYVENWNWLPINFSEDGLVGTFSTKGLPAQIGYGTWSSNVVWFEHNQYHDWRNHWDGVDSPVKSGDYSMWVEDDEFNYQEIYANKEIDETKTAADQGRDWAWEEWDHKDGGHLGAHSEGIQVHREYAYGPGWYVEIPTAINRDEDLGYDYTYTEQYILDDELSADVQADLEAMVQAARDALIEKYTKLKDWDAVDYLVNGTNSNGYGTAATNGCIPGLVEAHADGIVREYNKTYRQDFGTYELPDDFAFDGETVDGVHVRYGRYGECVQIAVTLTGVNFLGTDKTPVKTTVYWRPLEHYGKNVWNWYINNITEEYEDGSKLEAHFSSSKGGKLLGTKVIAAE